MAPQGIISLLKTKKYQGSRMSFRSKLSQFWNNVQYSLIPCMEKDLGKLSDKHNKLVQILELIRIEDFIPSITYKDGRPPKDRREMARAYIAKIVFKLPYTNQLVEYLKQDKQLKNICGWDSFREVPSEAKFSRAFKEFSNLGLPEKAHQFLIKEFYKDQIVGHVVKDSMPLEVREKPMKKISIAERKSLKNEKKKNKKNGELNRRQKQLKETDLDKMIKDLPTRCDTGMKKSAKGYTKIWKGYKLHAAVDDHCIPLAVIVSSASLNDCEVAIPLAEKSNRLVKNYYDLMDAAYDYSEIKEHSFSIGHVPIIDKRPNGKKQKIEKENEKTRKKLLNFETSEDKRYRERFPKERFNALYQDFHGGRNILYRGHSKVSCHVMFGVLVTAATLLINLTC